MPDPVGPTSAIRPLPPRLKLTGPISGPCAYCTVSVTDEETRPGSTGVGGAAATEFAFLVGIPTMFAATFYELLSMLKDGAIGGEDWGALAVAFIASMITAFISVKWLLRYIQSHRFTAFAVYRLVLGVALLLFLPAAA